MDAKGAMHDIQVVVMVRMTLDLTECNCVAFRRPDQATAGAGSGVVCEVAVSAVGIAQMREGAVRTAVWCAGVHRASAGAWAWFVGVGVDVDVGGTGMAAGVAR